VNPLVLSLTAIAAYLATAIWQGRTDWRATPARPAPVLLLGFAAVLLHGVLLYQAIFRPGGLDLGLANSLSLVGWQLALLVLLANLRQPLGIVITGLLPVAALTVAGMHWQVADRPLIAHTSWALDTHIVVSLAAYSLLALAAIMALGLAVQDYRLRHHKPGPWLTVLPPLAVLEHLLFLFLAAGFALLTLALFAGLVFVHDLFAQHLVHKTVLSLLAWLVFALLLWGRFRHGWRGRKAIRWTLAGFILLALAYFGSKTVLELVLGRHWG